MLNQNECTIEQEDSIVFNKMELTIEMGAAIILFITLFVRRNLIGCPGIPGRLIMKAKKTQLNPPRGR